MDKGLGRLFPPGHTVAELLTGWTEGDEFYSRRRLAADVLTKYRDAEARGDILDPGPRAIDFLHNLRRKPGPLTKSRQPGAVTGRVFSRSENETLAFQLLQP